VASNAKLSISIDFNLLVQNKKSPFMQDGYSDKCGMFSSLRTCSLIWNGACHMVEMMCGCGGPVVGMVDTVDVIIVMDVVSCTPFFGTSSSDSGPVIRMNGFMCSACDGIVHFEGRYCKYLKLCVLFVLC